MVCLFYFLRGKNNSKIFFLFRINNCVGEANQKFFVLFTVNNLKRVDIRELILLFFVHLLDVYIFDIIPCSDNDRGSYGEMC